MLFSLSSQESEDDVVEMRLCGTRIDIGAPDVFICGIGEQMRID